VAWVEVSLVHQNLYQCEHWNPASGCGHGLMGGRDLIVLFCAAYADDNHKPLCLVGCLGLPDAQPNYYAGSDAGSNTGWMATYNHLCPVPKLPCHQVLHALAPVHSCATKQIL